MRISFPLLVGDFAIALAAGGPVAPETSMVRHVTDGDTFRLTSGERVHILGIDAPETQPGQTKCGREIVLGKRAAASLIAACAAKPWPRGRPKPDWRR
ncbi:MAG: hypothetical protein P0Y59_10730 [Candidatus Sphingomonas phytovorans]|nr:hypothetical protein [Sphingomonas sp.]WEK02122.1 MAG: hypothetical protein P0Y59_10730 [Sphingomonas sp.]